MLNKVLLLCVGAFKYWKPRGAFYVNKNVVKVLVAETQVDLNRMVSAYINSKEDMRVIESVNDGKTAYDKIIELNPDVALISIILPVLDGLAIMEKCFTDRNMATKFIIMSDIKDPLIAQESFNIGASYYMLKPVDLEVLTRRIRLVGRCEQKENQSVPSLTADGGRNRDNNINNEITKLLLSIGVPCHLNGYQYLREAIHMVIQNSDYLYRVTKVIYPGLAKKFKSTADRVERSIRNAIDQAWASNNIILHHAYTVKPTNTQFISWMTEKIRMENQIQIIDIQSSPKSIMK